MKEVNKILVHEIEFRLIESGIHRVKACLEKLSEEQIHYKPNGNSNSINNQVLHLNGNVRQWLISTFSDIDDDRQRVLEFDPDNKKTLSELVNILDVLENDVKSVFPQVLSADLTEYRNVQCYNESLLSIIIHVIEHFSYHLGQITYITKMLLNIDTGYYADANLNELND